VVSQTGPRPPVSRRTFLRASAAALGGASAVAGCAGGTPIGRQVIAHEAPQATTADLKILNRLLVLERRTVAAYTAGMPLLDRRDRGTMRRFLNEELVHTGQLLALIKAGGGAYPPGADSYELGHPTDATEVLALLHALEREQVGHYLRYVPELSAGPVRAAVASILTVDAQHISMLRLIQGQVPVPSAFVTGAE
jgi:Ferritin-like domain